MYILFLQLSQPEPLCEGQAHNATCKIFQSFPNIKMKFGNREVSKCFTEVSGWSKAETFRQRHNVISKVTTGLFVV